MCWDFELILSDVTLKEAKKIAKAVNTRKGLALKVFPTNNSTPVIYIRDHKSVCACDMINDDGTASSNDELEILSDYRNRLTLTLERLYKEVPQGFMLKIIYAGMSPHKKKRISIQELSDKIRSGKMDFNYIYNIY